MRFKFLIIFFVLVISSCTKSDFFILNIGSNKISTEIAASEEERSQGLMFRDNMDENHGMIFIFDKERSVSFWMKNTQIPLSIAYINKKGVILEIYDMKPYSLESVPSKRSSVLYALEMNQGYFNRHNIKPGDTINLLDLKNYLKSSK